MKKEFNLDNFIKFPELARVVNSDRRERCMGMKLDKTRVYSSCEGCCEFNQAVEIHLEKSPCKDIQYVIEETDEKLIIRYKWKDYDIPKFDENWELEFSGVVENK